MSDVLDKINRLARAKFETELSTAVATALEAMSFLDASMASLERLLLEKPERATAAVPAGREALQKQASTIRRRLDTAQKTSNLNGLRDVARLAVAARTDADKLIAEFGPATLRDRGVHVALEQGARLFFAGDYRGSLTALESGELDSAPLQVHTHLLRAASLYHLFVRSGERDAALRTRALAEIDACKRLDPAFAPDARVFAPRFVQFFRNASNAAAR